MTKIFLIEDDEYIARVYERAFRLAGRELVIAIDGESAWAALSAMAATELPAVILLDISLPKMSGKELLNAIRNDVKFSHTPIAVLTNSFDENIEKDVLASGADLYMLKIDNEPAKIMEKIDSLINKAR